jgi:hypothetical protein
MSDAPCASSFCAGARSGRCRSQRATFGPVRVIGEGKDLWRVEVVLWAGEPEASRIGELLNAVAVARVASDEDDPSVLRDVERAWSYDMQPPEGGVGVACWVRADSVGGAAEEGWRVVREAAGTTLGVDARLWDLRVIPRAAILAAPPTGTPLTH